MSTLPLRPAEYLSWLEKLAAGFEGILRSADLDIPVTTCGDWRLRELGIHLGNVHRWAASVILSGENAPQVFDDDPGSELSGWYASSASQLVTALRAVDPSDRCWHFCAGDKIKAFWFRRQVFETAIHLVDASQASGRAVTIAPLVAADGVDEVLTAMLPKARRWFTPPPLPDTLLLRATDTGDAWLLSPGEHGESPSAEAVSDTGAAATVEASAEDLLLLLWKRRAAAEVDVRISGDVVLATTFLSAPVTP
jgi:uncharacterized protein (TIGR03083 family)